MDKLASDGLDANTVLISKFLAACMSGDARQAKALLDKGADIGSRDSDGEGTVLLAAACGRLDCLSVLLEAGADFAIEGKWGLGALEAAALRGHLDCFEILIEGGAPIDSQGHRSSGSLSAACMYGHTECVEKLLALGARSTMPTSTVLRLPWSRLALATRPACGS